jgi:hypothetical protein
MIEKVIVHKYSAHSDDFLAACVLLYKLPQCEIYRRDFTQEDLGDPNIWVIDQGLQFNPNLKNFDHHQFKQEICSFTQILEYFYGDIEFRDFMPELRFIEVCDSFGPTAAAKLIKTDIESVKMTRSPIVEGVLEIFSEFQDCRVNGPILILMAKIGENICRTIEEQKNLIDIIEDGYVLGEVSGHNILDVTGCVGVNRNDFDKLPTQYFCKMKKLDISLILTQDSREDSGYRLISINTDNIKIQPNPYSHFTHASGFLCCFKDFWRFQDIIKSYTISSKQKVTI